MGFLKRMLGTEDPDVQVAGLAGQATIVSLSESGPYVNQRPTITMDLDVELPERERYRAQARQPVGRLVIGRLAPGETIPVRVDPNDPGRSSSTSRRCWVSLTPPRSNSPDQADRVRQLSADELDAGRLGVRGAAGGGERDRGLEGLLALASQLLLRLARRLDAQRHLAGSGGGRARRFQPLPGQGELTGTGNGNGERRGALVLVAGRGAERDVVRGRRRAGSVGSVVVAPTSTAPASHGAAGARKSPR